MAQVKLLKDHYLGSKGYFKAGAVLDFEGPFSMQMEGVNAEGKAAVAAYRKRREPRTAFGRPLSEVKR